MQIDPRVALWLNCAYAILTGLTAPALQAAGIADAEHFIGVAALIAMPLNVILHAFTSSQPGPLAPADAPIVQVAKAATAAAATEGKTP